MYLISMLIAILGTVLYHFAQKSMPSNIDPVFGAIVTYVCALTISLVYFLFISKKSVTEEISHLNYAPLLLGVSIFLIEVGFLMVYRSGWDIGVAPLVASIASTVILVALGTLVFKDQLTVTKAAGFVVSVIGLFLITK
ncbi:hypothetical protein EZV73_02195 [Acidaminobacter sp. JC074]|uniref:EamA family transporter n=1 Tax=Acidaminobacter sp. JC074 TaxID=2530199 RepID=UPI001F100FB3|nr:hypothetical protein [Acidaminobacter sp. JC074]MCH4886357.1 hypothetical protein [Acidaminobacter sp. JC074]